MASSSSSASLGQLTPSVLRRLVSLESPRVAMGKRVSFIIKKERDDTGSVLLRVSSPPPPKEVQIVEVKKESDDHSSSSGSRLFFCALCLSRHGDDKLSSFCPPEPRRAQYLASLLGRSEEEVDIIFCHVCRETVRKLFKLREEVEEIEARIRAVVKLHPSIQRLDCLEAVKVESPDSSISTEDKSKDEDGTSLLHGSTTSLVNAEPKSDDADKCNNNVATSPHSDRDEVSPPDQKSSRSPRGQRNNKQVKITLEPRRKVVKTQRHKGSHMRKVHKGRTIHIATLPPIKSIQEGGPTLFLCPKCPQKFKVKSSVFRHLGRIHGPYDSRKMVCPVCQKRFRNSEVFKAHSHPDKSDPSVVSYKCQLCPKVFPDRDNLRRHKRRVHLKKEQRNCPRCGKQFKSTNGLQQHNKTCALPLEEQMKCHCGQVFATWAERLDHERVVHKRLTSTKCYFCFKFKSSTSNLFRHLRTHTRERPLVCVKCRMDFRDPSAFKYHIDRSSVWDR